MHFGSGDSGDSAEVRVLSQLLGLGRFSVSKAIIAAAVTSFVIVPVGQTGSVQAFGFPQNVPAASTSALPNPDQIHDASVDAAGSSVQLQGGVERTVKGALLGLKSFGEALHKLRRASGDLYGESTRVESNVDEEPDVIGGSIIYIPISVSVSDYLPPRKKWVDHFMGQLKELFPLVDDELNAILYPDDKAAEVAPLVNEIETAMKDSESHYQQLIPLSQSGPYDGKGIAAQCRQIDDDLKQVEKTRKRLRELVKEKDKT